MQFMIIEHFRPETIKALYQRFEEKGRMLPKGVKYINSWIDADVRTCWQLMEAENEAQIWKWIENWKDLTDFEVKHVIDSATAKEKVFSR